MKNETASNYPQLRIYYKTQDGTQRPTKNNKVCFLILLWRGELYANDDSQYIKMYYDIKEAYGEKAKRNNFKVPQSIIVQELTRHEENLYYYAIRRYSDLSYIRHHYFVKGNIAENCINCWNNLPSIQKQLEKAYLDQQYYQHYRNVPEELNIKEREDE